MFVLLIVSLLNVQLSASNVDCHMTDSGSSQHYTLRTHLFWPNDISFYQTTKIIELMLFLVLP